MSVVDAVRADSLDKAALSRRCAELALVARSDGLSHLAEELLALAYKTVGVHFEDVPLMSEIA
jgi:hypothetical protein